MSVQHDSSSFLALTTNTWHDTLLMTINLFKRLRFRIAIVCSAWRQLNISKHTYLHCIVDSRQSLYFTKWTGPLSSSKFSLPVGNLDPRLARPHTSLSLNGVSIGLIVLQGSWSWPTHTDHVTYDICSNSPHPCTVCGQRGLVPLQLPCSSCRFTYVCECKEWGQQETAIDWLFDVMIIFYSPTCGRQANTIKK